MTTETLIQPVKVGDIFVSSWGWDQTNVDFYEVVGITPSGKSARIVGIRSEIVEQNGYSQRVRPVPGSYPAAAVPSTKRLRYSTRFGGDVWITLTSYSSARRTTPDSTHHESGPYGGH
jgi:hypothetical protein